MKLLKDIAGLSAPADLHTNFSLSFYAGLWHGMESSSQK